MEPTSLRGLRELRSLRESRSLRKQHKTEKHDTRGSSSAGRYEAGTSDLTHEFCVAIAVLESLGVVSCMVRGGEHEVS
jgi:hypothetical protein